MPTTTRPEISSVGLPPEKHADRVVAAMMQYLVEQRYRLNKIVMDLVIDGFIASSPRAQNRLAQRLEKTGGAIQVRATTGKKGCYTISFFEILGWDPVRDHYIENDGSIPDKPWLIGHLTVITNPGKQWRHHGIPLIRNIPLVFITHHVLSRAAQRLGLRTTKDMLHMSTLMVIEACVWYWRAGGGKPGEPVTMDLYKSLAGVPEAGSRVTIKLPDNVITLVFKKHETRRALVATTIF